MAHNPRQYDRFLLLSLVFVSGFSALLYEVSWQRYLSALLGAQAKATAVILAIFLGGMALGYGFTGRWSKKPGINLFLAYALVEAGIGLWAFLFPYFFKGAMQFVPSLLNAVGVETVVGDLLVALALIGVPTFLMGGTLPLLTQAMSTSVSEATTTHSKIYGWNTIGAFFGTVITGYFLIPMMGLKASVMLGGCLNLLVAITTYFLFARNLSHFEWEETESEVPVSTERRPYYAIAFISGFTLIALQTILIRYVGLSAGASHYNFTTIVAVFILSLGVGSLLTPLASRLLGRFSLFWSQFVGAIALLLLFLSVGAWPYGAHVLRILFREWDFTFYLYQGLLAGALFSLLFIPLGILGLTLPLVFHSLKQKQETLGLDVGKTYGLNALGCVLGATLGGYVLLQWLNLDQLFRLCIFLVLVSAALAAFAENLVTPMSSDETLRAEFVGGLVLLGIIFAPNVDPRAFLQPFRYPAGTKASFSGPTAFKNYLAYNTEIVSHTDGPNSSVTITKSVEGPKETSRSIVVNGKSDGNTTVDLYTTVMLGHLPALLAPRPEHVAVIGFGTGMTVGALSLHSDVKSIDVVEISGTVLSQRAAFDSYNLNVSKSSKVHFHEMDAFRFLGASKERFDVIVSEPSNPWVTGVENLYSEEFYEIASRKMNPGGVFAQWLHTYSFNEELFRMVIATMRTHFPYVSVFQLRNADVILVGTASALGKQSIQHLVTTMRDGSSVRDSLAQLSLRTPEAVMALEVIGPTTSRALALGVGTNRVEAPVLSQRAAKSLFMGTGVLVNELRRKSKEYFSSVDELMLSQYLDKQAPSAVVLKELQQSFCGKPPDRIDYLCDEAALDPHKKEDFQKYYSPIARLSP